MKALNLFFFSQLFVKRAITVTSECTLYSDLELVRQQTMWTQVRCRIMWHFIGVFTVCHSGGHHGMYHAL